MGVYGTAGGDRADGQGEPREFRGRADTPLLWVLRDAFGLKGTKYGCSAGACGSCVVLLQGEPRHSCTLPVAEAAGKEVLTIEALAREPRQPLVQAWIAEQVPQCGYCQPAQLLTASWLLRHAGRVVEAQYETPYLAHATMEPMNCIAEVTDDACDIWTGTQSQQEAQARAMEITGLPRERVRLHTTYSGGGFGRRLETDYVVEAVRLAKILGRAVRVLWTRADDLRHDFYRPASLTAFRARGAVSAWMQRIAGPELALGEVDIPYAIPNLRVVRIKEDPGVPTGYWRSVGASQNAFSIECFVDELARAAGKDPLAFRLGLLAHEPRHRGVLELAAERAGWHDKLAQGRGRGVAVYRSYGSWVAQVAEVSVGEGGAWRVERVVCAADCGTVVNPDAVCAQMEGAVVFDLSAALHGEITLHDGAVVQSGFEDYPILRMRDTPEIEVHLLPSRAHPGGVGEPGVPPVAPAVANALFAATGRRMRRLPLLRS